MEIYIDADACPVKDEVYRVAKRYEIKVYVVANSAIFVPVREGIERVVVRGGMDIADDWIAERITGEDIAITADIPLADRCLKRGATVLGPRGLPFTDESIGNALAPASCSTPCGREGCSGPVPHRSAPRIGRGF